MKRWVIIFLGLLVLLGGAYVVSNQKTDNAAPQVRIDQRKLLVRPRNADGTIVEISFWQNPVAWASDKTQNYSRKINNSLRDIRGDEQRTAAILTLLLLSFGYGVFHAAGPGHGKVVLTTWLLATRSDLRRGLMIAGMSSFFQALSAIIFVTIPVLIFNVSVRDAPSFSYWLEIFSFAAIGMIGAYLVYSALVLWWQRSRKGQQNRPIMSGDGMPLHIYQQQAIANRQPVEKIATGYEFALVTVAPETSASQARTDDVCLACGHHHVPDPQTLRGAWSWKEAILLSLAIGSRPCTGALVILVLAFTMNIYWAGIMASFVMSFGTFLTVSAIAALAVFGRQKAEQLLARDSGSLEKLSLAVKIIGGLVLMGLGGLFLAATLSGVPSVG